MRGDGEAICSPCAGAIRTTLPCGDSYQESVQCFTSKGQHRLEFAVAPLFCRTAGRITFHQIQVRHNLRLTEDLVSRRPLQTGAVGVTRTLDLLITNQLLYQLSYNSTLTGL